MSTIGKGINIPINWISYRDSLFEFLSKKKVMAALTLLPASILFVFVNLVPMGWAVAASFYRIGTFNPTWEFIGFQNYEIIFGQEAFWASMWRSVLFAVSSVSLQLSLGLVLAFLLDRSFKWKHAARTLAMLPYLIPTAVVAMWALWMGNAQSGIVNSLAMQAGLIDSYIAWFGNFELSFVSVVVTGSWKWLVFVTIMVLARLQGIPDEFYEAARMSGASTYQVFRDIVIPNIKGVIFIVLLLRGVWMFNKFDIIYILTRGGPHDATTTATIYAFQRAFNQQFLDQGAAISVVLFAILVVAALIYFRQFNPSSEVRVE